MLQLNEEGRRAADAHSYETPVVTAQTSALLELGQESEETVYENPVCNTNTYANTGVAASVPPAVPNTLYVSTLCLSLLFFWEGAGSLF